MTSTRHIATAALALGALAATALQTTPADAFPGGVKLVSDGGREVLTIKGKGFQGTSRPNSNIPPLNKFNPNHPSVGLAQDGPTKISPSTSQPNPNTIFGGSGGGKLPPVGGSQPNPNTMGGLGGGKLPPITGNVPNPNVPGGNTGNGNLPPISGNVPNPNLPWGNPGNGGGNKGPKGHGYGHIGSYVEFSGDGGGYRPCWWLRRKFQATGNVYWLNRFRHCLWRHYGG